MIRTSLTGEAAIAFIVQQEAALGLPFDFAYVMGRCVDEVGTHTVVMLLVRTANTCWDVWELNGDVYCERNDPYFRDIIRRQEEVRASSFTADLENSIWDDVEMEWGRMDAVTASMAQALHHISI